MARVTKVEKCILRLVESLMCIGCLELRVESCLQYGVCVRELKRLMRWIGYCFGTEITGPLISIQRQCLFHQVTQMATTLLPSISNVTAQPYQKFYCAVRRPPQHNPTRACSPVENRRRSGAKRKVHGSWGGQACRLDGKF